MKLFRVIGGAAIGLLILLPCHGCGGASTAGRAFPRLFSKFAKSGGTNFSRLSRQMKKPTVTRLRNGRLAPAGQASKFAKVKVPSPTRIDIVTSGKVGGSSTARSAVTSTEVDLVLFDSVGQPIYYSNPLSNAAVYRAATRAYRGEVVSVVDDVLAALPRQQIKTEAQLQSAIKSAVDKRLSGGARQFDMNVTTGNLTLDVEFAMGSRIYGTINIYKAVGSAVAVGGGGYYVVKRS